ncbi:proton-conducting transporter transmembrane domain-containing protein [Desulfoferrobacter suflitae]|uniref:proton-conducting transporter transmembrane domain-containing protein n=1 Tax=Desulfoferrobacter suflitae TaxID=2865782 RepID=UPI0021641200|nr:proton-conducting transporter membrane subunit [Desulfoferrobacter suflitae]MCK8600365.1 hypothetical protein [Desulfoferrobacter suflitae]
MLFALVLGPLAAGVIGVLIPRIAVGMLLLSFLLTCSSSLFIILAGITLRYHLIDSYGVAIMADPTAAWFMLTNGVVFTAVLIYIIQRKRLPFFLMLMAFLHGSLNACFVADDLFNLYVVLELTTIIAFLMIGCTLKDRHLWNALRYLFLSNIGMLFFLIGTIMVYESSGDFALASLTEAPHAASLLIITGLLVKGGVFLPGLWLPHAHSQAETPVSAILSGVVVKMGLLPLIRLAELSPGLGSVVSVIGICAAVLGITLAAFERDIKRFLACSTLSQVGFVLVAPAAGALYAFGHGVAKASLFLATANLPTRDLPTLRENGVSAISMTALTAAGLSICGVPLMVGFNAKTAVFQSLVSWQYWVMLAAATCTAGLLARLLFLPVRERDAQPGSLDHWQALLFLTGIMLLFGIIGVPEAFSDWAKAAITLLVGWLLHRLFLGRLNRIELPADWEHFEHLVGMTCVMLLILLLFGVMP